MAISIFLSWHFCHVTLFQLYINLLQNLNISHPLPIFPKDLQHNKNSNTITGLTNLIFDAMFPSIKQYVLEIEKKVHETGFTFHCCSNNDLDAALEIVFIYFLLLRMKFRINFNPCCHLFFSLITAFF